ncbi:MAG: CvpA family protein [Candidatus Omnitrophota bacterium]|nr:CvpA family protein [Candidatus Omnitrophota bacterium]
MEPLSLVVDGIIFMVVLYNVLVGFRRGLSGFLLDFLILGLSLGISWFYYRQAGNILFSLVIFIFTLLFLIIVRYFLFGLRRAWAQKESRFSIFNQFGGLLLGLIRAIVIITVLYVLIEILPLGNTFERNFKKTVESSVTCTVIQKFIPSDKFALLQNITVIAEVIYDSEALGELKEQLDVVELLKNKNIKIIIERLQSNLEKTQISTDEKITDEHR